MIELTNYLEMQEDINRKVVLECTIKLDKKTMLNILQSEAICISGEYYKVPERTILNLLLNKKYGHTRLTLEKIISTTPKD